MASFCSGKTFGAFPPSSLSSGGTQAKWLSFVVPKQSGSPTPFVGPAEAAKIREVFPALGMQFLYIFGFFLNNGMGLCSYCLLVISRVSDPPTALCTLLSLHDPSPLNFFFL